MYPTELRLTLALSLGGSAAPSPKKNCSSCCTMISWCVPSGAFSRELEAGQLPAGGFGSTVPGFSQVGDGGPRRSGWDERKGRRRFVPVFVHGALQQFPGFLEDNRARRTGLGFALHHGFEVALEPVNPAVRVCPRIAQRFLLERSDGRVVQWQDFQQARPGGNQQADGELHRRYVLHQPQTYQSVQQVL